MLSRNYRVIRGDCAAVIQNGVISKKSVNLIVTSPPYADQRKNLYGGPPPSEYVEWFLPKSEQFKNVLTHDGSFVLNIKEKATNGTRHPYVLQLILALQEQGWRWVEEYCWHKKNCYPGKWPNGFRDAWERCLHFTLNKQFKMRQDSVKVPMGDWWTGREKVYPTNVLSLATECGYKGHPSAFPVALPEWFIRLFTDENDTVMDPFSGSGSTIIAAKRLNRKSIAIDTSEEYCALVEERIRLQE